MRLRMLMKWFLGQKPQTGKADSSSLASNATLSQSWTFPEGTALGFVVVFSLLACILLGLYYFPYENGTSVRACIEAYLHGYTAVAGAVLSVFDHSVQVRGHDIIGRYSLRIVRTCDAMDVKILYVSAVFAWPAAWERRVAAAVLGVTSLFVVNVARICALYYVGVLAPAYFKFAHHELLPAFVLVVAVGAFIMFTASANRASAAKGRNELA